jgi:hypothetical protein
MGKQSRRKNNGGGGSKVKSNKGGVVLAAAEDEDCGEFIAATPGVPLQTNSATLQNKLDQLVMLGSSGDKATFVQNFVPLDLSQEEALGYLSDLSNGPEAEGQWTNLVAELQAIATGTNVKKIGGDQVNQAIFYFEHPLLAGCDREVSFICVGGEWRAEG